MHKHCTPQTTRSGFARTAGLFQTPTNIHRSEHNEEKNTSPTKCQKLFRASFAIAMSMSEMQIHRRWLYTHSRCSIPLHSPHKSNGNERQIKASFFLLLLVSNECALNHSRRCNKDFVCNIWCVIYGRLTRAQADRMRSINQLIELHTLAGFNYKIPRALPNRIAPVGLMLADGEWGCLLVCLTRKRVFVVSFYFLMYLIGILCLKMAVFIELAFHLIGWYFKFQSLVIC